MKLGVVVALALLLSGAAGFTILPITPTTTRSTHSFSPPPQQEYYSRRNIVRTRHYALLDVPDNFFTILLPSLSLFLAFSKANARSRLEERAWEQRLQEARLQQLEKDPSLLESDLKKREAAAEWSAYGNNNSNSGDQDQDSFSTRLRQRVMTRTQQQDDDDVEETRREFRMTEEEIEEFEEEFGVEFDPYYDDPYTEDELPTDVPYKVDKQYGDRIYKDGEVFYKDSKSGLFYRQGSQPRITKFW